MAAGGSNTRPLRIVIMVASALALAAVATVLVSAGETNASSDELMYGGPLSFDMVHTHILNMKMRRSRLKEKLKEAALKRKDREIAQEHGFNQGSMVWLCVATCSSVDLQTNMSLRPNTTCQCVMPVSIAWNRASQLTSQL